jgi:hypothetical protein
MTGAAICHLGLAALSAAEVQSSLEESQSRLHAGNEHASQAMTLRLNFAVSKRSVDQAVNYGPRGGLAAVRADRWRLVAACGAGQPCGMRVVVTHIWAIARWCGVGRMPLRAATASSGANSPRAPWLTRRLTGRFAAGRYAQIRVYDQVVMVAERDLTGPLRDLVAAVLDQADAE